MLHLRTLDHASLLKPFQNPDYLVPPQFPDLVEVNPEGLNKLVACENLSDILFRSTNLAERCLIQNVGDYS